MVDLQQLAFKGLCMNISHFNMLKRKLEMIKEIFEKYIGVDKRYIDYKDLLRLERVFEEELELKVKIIGTKRLSPMELIVVALVVFESSYKLRANYLCINGGAVKMYERRVKKKLNVRSRDEAIARLREAGIITDPNGTSVYRLKIK